MAVRFFGQYLLEKGLIDAERLLAAINHQEKHNRKFGDTAVALGLMTAEQLQQALNLQRAEDVKTGEAAVKLGFLKPTHIEQVLRAQRNSHVPIGEALVATGALTRERMEQHLAAFQDEQAQYRTTLHVPAEFDPTGLAAPAVDLVVKFLLRMADLQAKVADCFAGPAPSAVGRLVTARVGFTGDLEGEVGMRVPVDLAARIASRVAGEPIAETDDDGLLDGVREFLNVICGSLAAAASRTGKDIELTAPLKGNLPTPRRFEHMMVARLAAPEGGLEVAVLTRAPVAR